MDRRLEGFRNELSNRMGYFYVILEPSIKKAATIELSEEEYQGQKAFCRETREAFLAGLALVDKHEANIEDRKLDGGEMFDELVDFEGVADEFEDIVTGVDEDD